MSPECFHKQHSACACEDACTCRCHLRDLMEREQDVLDEDCLPDEDGNYND